MDGRPDTFHELLDEIANWLDLADKAFARIAWQAGEDDFETGDGVQRDLRRMAELARQYPAAPATTLWFMVRDETTHRRTNE